MDEVCTFATRNRIVAIATIDAVVAAARRNAVGTVATMNQVILLTANDFIAPRPAEQRGRLPNAVANADAVITAVAKDANMPHLIVGKLHLVTIDADDESVGFQVCPSCYFIRFVVPVDRHNAILNRRNSTQHHARLEHLASEATARAFTTNGLFSISLR